MTWVSVYGLSILLLVIQCDIRRKAKIMMLWKYQIIEMKTLDNLLVVDLKTAWFGWILPTRPKDHVG
jgi:hypothetical protein